jgi:hypothetical protein
MPRPIPATGLDPGLAFDPAYADSFRVAELPRVALRDRGTPNDLASFSDGWAVKGNSVYFKTPTGDAPGTGSEPGYRVVVGNPSYLAFLSFNDFGPNRVPFVEVAGLAVSLQVGKFGMRTLQVNPADSATIRDMLFVACNDNDNVACVNGGGAGDEIRILRNQHLGVGEDGGPIVVSTQAVNDPYDLLVIEDQVTHVGYRLLTIDGNDAGLWRAPRFAIGSFHGGKVLSARVERCIGLSYNNTATAMFQLPAGPDQIAGLDPRDGDATAGPGPRRVGRGRPRDARVQRARRERGACLCRPEFLSHRLALRGAADVTMGVVSLRGQRPVQRAR